MNGKGGIPLLSGGDGVAEVGREGSQSHKDTLIFKMGVFLLKFFDNTHFGQNRLSSVKYRNNKKNLILI